MMGGVGGMTLGTKSQNVVRQIVVSERREKREKRSEDQVSDVMNRGKYAACRARMLFIRISTCVHEMGLTVLDVRVCGAVTVRLLMMHVV